MHIDISAYSKYKESIRVLQKTENVAERCINKLVHLDLVIRLYLIQIDLKNWSVTYASNTRSL